MPVPLPSAVGDLQSAHYSICRKGEVAAEAAHAGSPDEKAEVAAGDDVEAPWEEYLA